MRGGTVYDGFRDDQQFPVRPRKLDLILRLGGGSPTRKGNMLMKTNERLQMKEGGLRFLGRCLRVLVRPVWTPEADERRFLAGLPIVMFLIIFLWGRGLLQSMGPYPVLVNFAFWCIAYMVKFGKRLQNRGEFKRVLIASAAFCALLLSGSLL